MIKLIATISAFMAIVSICVIYAAPIDYKPVNKVCSPEIKEAIYRMGPGKDYRLHPDGKLEVSVRGKWLILRY